jgi:uncharacterized protein (DUF2147 family)
MLQLPVIKRLSFLVLFLVAGNTGTFAQNKPDDVLGEWLGPNKDSRVLIYKQGNTYSGKITWGTGSDPKDVKNPNPALRSRELIGTVILNGFQFDGQYTWEKGTIYDPRSGSTYNCTMRLKDANNLNIRGYIGISLFGRTEIWTRVQ